MSTRDFKELPSAQAISEAYKLYVYDSKGRSVLFGSLLAPEGQVIVVFIRHFFCGNCQDYVSELAKVDSQSLKNANTHIIVVGCGDFRAIANYSAETQFNGIYADPTRDLYHMLGMDVESLAQTPAGQDRPTYLKTGNVENALKSIWNGPLKNIGLIGKQGNLSQLGGDFIFSGGRCSFASRMKHTQDHIGVAELMAVVGVAHP